MTKPKDSNRKHWGQPIILFLIFCLLGFLSEVSVAQTTIYSASGGAWLEGTTWEGGSVPAPTDNAVIRKGHTVSLATGSGETIHSLTIQAGGVLDARNKPMAVTGNLIVDGTYTSDDNSAKDLDFSGDTIGGLGTIAINDESQYLDIASDAVILSSAHLHLFGNVYIRNNVSVTNQGHIEVNGSIIGQDASGSVWTQQDDSRLDVAGVLLSTGILNASATGNTVMYFLQGPQDIKTPAGNAYYDLIISGSGVKAQEDNLLLNNDLQIRFGTLDGNDYDIELKGSWTNESDYIEGSSTVSFTGTADQFISNSSGEQFFGLTVDKASGRLILEHNVTVSNTLTMDSGIIEAQSGKLTLGTGLLSPGAVVYASGHIFGSFERWITAGGTYTYPVGSSVSGQFLYIILNGLETGGTLTAEFQESDPANNGLPLFDNPDSVYNAFVDGYWDLMDGNGFVLGAANNYDMVLDGTGFTAFPVNSSTRVLIRPDIVSLWGVEGNHLIPLGSSARRAGLTTLPAQYAFGDTSNCSRPVTSAISGTPEVCTGSMGVTYSVTDNPSNTYAWIITGGIQSGGGSSSSITVDWGTTGTYGNVRVIESNACTQGAPENFPVTVHSIQPEEISGRASVAEYTLGEPYSVPGIPGYSYYWTITGGTQNPAGNGPSITVDWDSNGIGMVSVAAQMPGCPVAPATEMEINKYVIIESIASGSWTDPSTWDCDCVPLPTENVRINNTHTVTLPNGPDAEVNHFIIEAGGVLNTNNKALYIHGNFIVNGTYQGGSKILQMDGFGKYIDGTGTITQELSLAADVYFTTTAVLSITGGGITIGAGNTISNYGTVSLDGSLSGTDAGSKWINKPNSTLRVGEALLATGILDASAAGNSVAYNGPGLQSIKVPASTYANLVTDGNGTKTLIGDIDVEEGIWLEGSAILDVSGSNYSINLAGNWVNQGGVFNEQSGRVFFDGSEDQTVYGAETFSCLELSNAGDLILDTNIVILDSLLMKGGNIHPGSDTLKIGNGAGNPGAISRISGIVTGKVERWITQTGTPYIFPVGSTSDYRPARLTFTDLNQGTVVAQFIEGDPGSAGLPLSEGAVSIANQYTEGFWEMAARSGLSTNDYDLQLTATNFSSYTLIPGTRIIKRPSGGDWTLDGVHAPASPPDLYRNNLTGGISTTGTQFGVGHIECPGLTVDRVITDVSCYGGNDGAIDVTVSGGTAPYTYAWGHGPSTEDVNNLTAGSYDLNVTDSDGCEVDSTFTVNEPDVLYADLDSTGVTCLGGSDGSITISNPSGGSGTYEYSVSGAGGPWEESGSFTGLTAGSYDVRIRDALVPGCYIVLNPALVLTEPNDFIPPLAVCTDTTVYLDATGTANIDSSWVDGGSTDNCSIATMTIDRSTFNCTDIGANTVQLTVSDNSSNTDNCNATVTVLDTISPVLTCPGDRVETVDASCQLSLPDYTGLVSVIENCSLLSLVQDPVPGTLLSGHGTTQQVTITATDASANTGQCSFTVTLDDTADPVALCKDTTVYLDATGTVLIDSSFVNDGSTDNCGIATMEIDISAFNCTDIGANTVTLLVTDVAGNTDFCAATVTVLDTISPAVTCPGDRNETVDGSLNFTLPDYTPLAVASDNCSGLPVLTQDPLPGTVISGIGTIQPITITADDGNGNSAQCLFNITLVSPPPPTIACPPERDEYLDENCQFVLPDYSGLATVSNEDTVIQMPTPGTIISGPMQSITLTAYNALNDSAQCTFNIMMRDTITPVVSCKNDTILTASPGTCSLTVEDISPVSVSDNCAINNITYRITGATAGSGTGDASGTSFNKGISTLWYIASDQSGNADSCSIRLTVLTNVVPPDAASADRDSVCAGDGFIQLEYSGGIMVEGGLARWYDDASMLNSIGMGSPLVIPAPLTSTEYFVRFEGNCDTSSAVSVRVEVLTGSVGPVSAASDRNNICPGNGFITLSYSGGILGNGALAEWYSDTAMTQNIGSGNHLSIPAPMVSTAYFVRFEGLCDTSGAAGFLLTVNELSSAPVSAQSDRDSVCPGDGNIILSYSGGYLGSGGSVEWYDDSLFTSHVGSGNDLVLEAPSVATTYFVRFEAQCDTSSSVSTRVHTYASPAPVLTEAADRACTSGMLSRYVVGGLPGSSFTWNVERGIIVADYSDSILVDWGAIAGEFEVSVRETSKDGCQSQFIFTQVSVSGPDVDLGPDQEICGAETYEIIPDGNFTMLNWHDGSTTPTYTVDTTELAKIQVFDEYGCTAQDSVRVNHYPMPVVNLGNDTSLCGDASLILDAGNPGAVYSWSTGETTRQIEVFAGAQLYWVEVTYGTACTANGEIVVRDCMISDRFSNIPNLITPNGDGRNDTWIFYEAADYPDIVVEIYDRWGRLVFRSEPGYSNPWDGRNMNGKELPMDSYHYIIKIGDENITGTITVVR